MSPSRSARWIRVIVPPSRTALSRKRGPGREARRRPSRRRAWPDAARAARPGRRRTAGWPGPRRRAPGPGRRTAAPTSASSTSARSSRPLAAMFGAGQGQRGGIALEADERDARPPRGRGQQHRADAAAGLQHPLAGLRVAGRRQQGRVEPGAIALRRLAQRTRPPRMRSSVTVGVGFVHPWSSPSLVLALTLPYPATIVCRNARTPGARPKGAQSWTQSKRPSRVPPAPSTACSVWPRRTWTASTR